MTHEPMPLNPPPYGSGTLPDLACSLLASLRVPGEPDVLGLPPADRVCLLIVDGLGWELLREHQAAAPFLSELAANGRADLGRLPRDDGDQPELARHRPAARPARHARLPGGTAR